MPNRPLPGLPHPIAIDGPAASGKSTVGQALAAEFGYLFLDTGLMYRAFTLAALRAGVGADDPAACEALAASLPLTARAGSETSIFLGDEDVTGELRAPAVEANVSKYSAIPGVRSAMVGRQREVAQSAPAVLAGRDIGTVVLPDAPLKIFLTATAGARAERRYKQLIDKGMSVSIDTLLQDLRERDARDSARAVAPLQKCADAELLDTTAMTVEEAVAWVVDKARRSLPHAAVRS